MEQASIIPSPKLLLMPYAILIHAQRFRPVQQDPPNLSPVSPRLSNHVLLPPRVCTASTCLDVGLFASPALCGGPLRRLASTTIPSTISSR